MHCDMMANVMVLQEFSVVRFGGDKEKADAVYKGVDPLTPDDIAEVVVFTAGRRENVVIADTLVFPNHQVSLCRWILCREFPALTVYFSGCCNSDASEIVISDLKSTVQ